MILTPIVANPLGNTVDPYVGAGFPYQSYLISGTASLAGNITFNPSVATLGATFKVRWEADVTVNSFAVVICGITINQSDVNQSGTFDCYYDGSNWSVQYFADGTDQPQVFYGVNNVTAPTSGTITLTAGVDKYYQRIVGAPTTLVGNLIITANTAGVKDGTQFFVQIAGSITLGVNNLTVFGFNINSTDALNGNAMVIATFDAGASVWRAQYIRGSFELSNLGAIAALTVIANATNATAQPTALAAAANGRVLMRRSNALEFGFLEFDNFSGSTQLFAPKTTGGIILSANVLTSGTTPVVLIDEIIAQGIPVLLTIMFGMTSGGSGYSTHTNIGIRYTGASDDIGSFDGALAIAGTGFYSHQIVLEPPASGAVQWSNSIELYTKSGNPTGGTRNILWQAFYTTIPSP